MFLPTDDELFAAVKLHDRKAFNLLYDRYWAIIYKKAFIYLHDTEACMGIVNDIFINIWEKRSVLNIISFKNYLTAAARYRVYNHIKASSTSRLTYIEDYEKLTNVGTDHNDGEGNIWKVELKKDLERVLDNLPARCREIFVLSRLEHLTNTEIALKLSISQRTVENQLSYALRYLKPFLKQYVAMMLLIEITFKHLS
ncbi:sigma-70 family RNA polymerase sigma factor [Mucilaginibacter sp. Bleaf8]|uniref:sigma-70 family RNA polymerase sigma factor n=1 Tax=Mucilaginibacter sp. Bleaf8 TaxID=2834430 RepID=UPI001BCB4F7B|nr:sigma-70 family RNA polymerase sigma factor [Mucilaginibacter sp. Bleaf8]MBS7562917.1 sigma-70 family RNA polymerase sigma factor [Mucilaginibacter sp. Bleaf8]